MINEDSIEMIPNEIDDDYSDDSLFNIASWGADMSFRELISMYDEDELVKPELQRKYVWDKMAASRFIESILLGLPVPSIFLAKSGSQKLIIDGYQRIMTVYDYVQKGIFSKDNSLFRLSNSPKINERWRNKSFQELSTDDQRKIRSTTIHAIVFEQKEPKDDDTSYYQIFERINTSGQSLLPQEIRNCVYQGSFNELLFSLNKNEIWRSLFGNDSEDSRMRDLEYILRFFTMKSDRILETTANRISLKKELNSFMSDHRYDDDHTINLYRSEFIDTITSINDNLGENAFRNYVSGKFTNKFHPAIFDAVSVAFFEAIQAGVEIKPISEERHIRLLENEAFKDSTSNRTTDTLNIKRRISLVHDIFFNDGGETDE